MTRSRLVFPSRLADEEPTVNLTPLIDVVFVILIMFIVIAPLLELDRVELADAPLASLGQGQSVQESSPIAIHVFQDNTIRFNDRIVSPTELTALLIEAKRHHPQARPQVFHDRRAYFGTYQLVKNAVEAAGFSQIDMILKPS